MVIEEVEVAEGVCDWVEEIYAPTEFVIQPINKIEDNINLKDIQFVTEEIGYLLAGNNKGGFAEMYQTKNGGQTWNDLELTIKESPLSMFFINEAIGIVSHYGQASNYHRTEDGGETWMSMKTSNLTGNLYHIEMDKTGDLYAVISGLNLSLIHI